jgi:hypothetical protein
MKKLILCSAVGVVMALSYGFVTANENSEKVVVTSAPEATTVNTVNDVDQYIKNVYSQIDFSKSKKLDYEVFQKAMYGYLNLKNEGNLSNEKEILTVCDFSKSSVERRLWVLDLKANKVLINDYVAHGQGSGEEYATAFSNTSNSHQSSLGFYVTDETYIGKHGESLRLKGMDKGFNSAAYERAVVVHGASYVSEDFIAGQKRLGRSWGCPAVSNQIAGKMINTIKDGTCLFVYSPQKEYLQTAYWLNKKVDMIPATMMQSKHIAANIKADSSISYDGQMPKSIVQ